LNGKKENRRRKSGERPRDQVPGDGTKTVDNIAVGSPRRGGATDCARVRPQRSYRSVFFTPLKPTQDSFGFG
jgi:hypothetical protein